MFSFRSPTAATPGAMLQQQIDCINMITHNDEPLPLPFLLCLQVIIQDIEVSACAALYLMLPGRRRVGAPEAPGSGQL
jgi:hypothetical protein